MDFNNFYISGNRSECRLQVSYLLINSTCDVNMRSRSWHRWAATASAACLASRWSMMQLTSGHRTCVLMFVPVVDSSNTPCECQFVFSVLDELYVSHHAWCSG